MRACQVFAEEQAALVKQEVQELAALFPVADLITLSNVYEAAGGDIAAAKKARGHHSAHSPRNTTQAGLPGCCWVSCRCSGTEAQG